MSIFSNYRKKKEMAERLQRELQDLEGQEEMKKGLEFGDKVRDLIKEYDMSAKDVLEVVSAQYPEAQKLLNLEGNEQGKNGSRKARPWMVYRNPYTGEEVKTKGGNHKTLKDWRTEYGKEVVDQWRERLD